MKVVRLKPGCSPEVVEVGSGLADLQREVGGYVEIIPTALDGVFAVINEEGELRRMAPNGVGLKGTVLFCRRGDEGDLVGLDDDTASVCISAIEQGQNLRQN